MYFLPADNGAILYTLAPLWSNFSALDVDYGQSLAEKSTFQQSFYPSDNSMGLISLTVVYLFVSS